MNTDATEPVLVVMAGLFRQLRHLVPAATKVSVSGIAGRYFIATCGAASLPVPIGPYVWCAWPICPTRTAAHPHVSLAWSAVDALDASSSRRPVREPEGTAGLPRLPEHRGALRPPQQLLTTDPATGTVQELSRRTAIMTVLHEHPVTSMTTAPDQPGWLDVLEYFAADPIADHSAQFPLGQSTCTGEHSVPSAPPFRPWGLGAMFPARRQGEPIREVFTYDHVLQMAVNSAGQPLTMAEPTVNKVSDGDGDEGPSEDFTYDYCPDTPLPA